MDVLIQVLCGRVGTIKFHLLSTPYGLVVTSVSHDLVMELRGTGSEGMVPRCMIEGKDVHSTEASCIRLNGTYHPIIYANTILM